MRRRNPHFFHILLACCFTLSLSTAAGARCTKDYPGCMELAKYVGKKDMNEIYRQLNLTEDQKLALEANREKNHQRAIELKKRLASLKVSLKEELAEANLNEKRINNLKQQLDEVMSQLTDLRLKGILEIRKILTAEQYKRFSEQTR